MKKHIDYTEQIKEILERFNEGIDCSEDESAMIKQWHKNTILDCEELRTLSEELIESFPCEYSEAIEEQEQGL